MSGVDQQALADRAEYFAQAVLATFAVEADRRPNDAVAFALGSAAAAMSILVGAGATPEAACQMLSQTASSVAEDLA